VSKVNVDVYSTLRLTHL